MVRGRFRAALGQSGAELLTGLTLKASARSGRPSWYGRSAAGLPDRLASRKLPAAARAQSARRGLGSFGAGSSVPSGPANDGVSVGVAGPLDTLEAVARGRRVRSPAVRAGRVTTMLSAGAGGLIAFLIVGCIEGRCPGPGPPLTFLSGDSFSGVPAHHVTIAPVRVPVDDGLGVGKHLRGVGFAWRCRCGERGAVRRTWRDARADAMAHQLSPPAASAEPAPDVGAG